MFGKKLTELLNSFNKYELNRFRKYIQSPYFNENKILIDLFSYLDTAIRYPDEALSKEKVWQKLYRELPFNDLKFRRLCSDLGGLAQNFLALKAFTKSNQTDSFLLKELNERNLNKHFTSVERNIRQQQKKRNHLNSDAHYIQYLLELELDQYLQKNIRRNQKLNLEETDLQLDLFYFSRKLKNYADALNYQNVINVNISLSGKDELIQYIKTNNYLDQASIGIYYQIMLMLESFDQEEHLDKLIEMLNNSVEQFPTLEIRNMYIFAQNYCIKKINLGNRSYFRKLFEIYQSLLDKKIIFKQDELLPWDYKNIVTVGLRLGEYDWIENFIHSYNDFLPNSFRQNALIFNMAQLYFHRKAYEKVILLLQEVVYQDIFYTLDSKWILLKTYYELKERDAMESLLESFRIFLLRHKILSKVNQKRYLNLLRYFKRLSRMHPSEQLKIEKLRKSIEDERAIPEKTWLLDKLGQL